VKLKLATALDAPVARLLETQRAAFERERDQRLESQRAARDTGDAGRLFIADAALRETQAALATLDLSAALAPRARGIARESSARPLVIIGSDDPLLARLAQTIHATTRAVGSVGGLLALANREADIAGAHLLDVDTREYNVPFVRHLLPEDEMVLVNLAVRENGLLIARGNPKNLRGVRDLTRRDVRLINRQRGAGTRLLLFAKLRAARIDARALRDWDRVAQTHDAVAAAIATGAVDVGPGLRATAHAWNLDFIPLGEERFDLVIPRVEFESPRLRPILDALHSKSFRDHALAGYDLARTGRVVARVR
jgi:putative molybdopterin biosynthesis protein